MKRRVVITGMGVVSALEIGVENFWNEIMAGKSGISNVSRFDTSNMPTKVAAEIKEFTPNDFMSNKESKRLDRFSLFAVAASTMAVENSKLNLDKINKDRMGVIFGSGIGGIETFENQYDIFTKKGFQRVSPFLIPMMITNMATGLIAIKFGARGFNECVVSACSTSANAIGDATRNIRHGYSDIIIAGGSEAAITPLGFAGFCSMRAMSTTENPNIACRPFDAERNGFVMGEGAGAIIIEEFEHATSRGANIIAEIIGYGCTNDSYDIVAPLPGGEGAAKCMKAAIDDAGIDSNDVQYINAHGTSTEYNDKYETKAIKKVFNGRSSSIPISSTKSMTGHLLGASGAIETIITALSLKNGFLPPTINYKTPDIDCDLDYIENTGRKADITYALSNSFGFGGHNVTIALKKFEYVSN